MADAAITVFDAVGGQPFFDRLAVVFYDGVKADPTLRPLYPEDLGPSTQHLALFLGQYWGGPATYSERRGHPRLRMRHAPFAIGDAQRAAWLRHMTDAVTTASLPYEIEAQLLEYFEMAAAHLVNTAG